MKSLRKDLIELIPGKFHRNSGWLQTKCPVCDGTSKKSHLNICLKEGSPIIYKCFRASCGISGVLNRQMARKIGIYSSNLLEAIDTENLLYHKYNDNVEYYKNEKSKYKLGVLSDKAKDYFYKRTGHDADEYQAFFRICSDLEKFYKDNKDKLNYDKLQYIIKKHKKGSYIYFFNDTYTLVYYREIGGDNAKGKYPLIEKKDSLKVHKPCTFRNKGENKLHKKRGSSTLFIAEGIFDIINAFFHVSNSFNGYFMASSGFVATKGVIQTFSKYFYKPYVVVFSDSDVDIEYYRFKILPSIVKRISSLVIIYNRKAHDMGEVEKGFDLERIVIYEEE